MRPNRQSLFESLEPRRLLTTLFVSGTSGPDNIAVWVPGDGLIHVGVGAGTATFSDTTYNQINIDTGGDADQISIFGIGNNFTQVNAGAGDDDLVISGPSIASLDGSFAPLSISGGIGADDLTIDDTANVFDDDYIIHYSTFSRDAIGTISYDGFETFTLQAGSGDSNFTILSSPRPTNWYINAGDGLDTVQLGDGFTSLDSIGPVWFWGQAGDDAVVVDDTAAPDTRLYNVYSNGLTESRGTFGGLSFDSVDPAYLLAGEFSDYIRVNATNGARWSVQGRGGNDNFYMGGGNLDQIQAHVEISGGVDPLELDLLEVDDSLRTDGDSFTLSAGEVGRPAFAGVSYAGIEHLWVRAQQAPNEITVFSTSCRVTIEPEAGDDTIRVKETSPGAAVSVRASGGLDTVLVNEDSTGTAEVVFPDSVHLATLMVNSGGRARMLPGGSAVLVTKALTINGTGVLDLNDNDLLVTNTPRSTIESYIRSAYDFGAWDGPGIYSFSALTNPAGNTTLGLLSGQEFNDNHGGLFDGQVVNNSDVVVKYTYYGDVDFNGSIDASDYNLIDFGFANHFTGWGFGDADYSGGVDVSDYNLIDFAFASQTGVL